MPVTNIKSKWTSGNLYFTDKSGNNLLVLQSGDHLLISTYESTKTVRVNSRTYTVAASIVGMQTKPRAGVAMTDDIIGIESMPGVNSTFTGKGIACFKAEPYWGATAGALSGDVRGYEVTLGKPTGAGAVSGGVYGMMLYNNCNSAGGAITNGIYPLYIATAGDNMAWSGFAVFPDDGQIATTSGDKSGGTKGWVKVLIGSSTYYLQAYAGA